MTAAEVPLDLVARGFAEHERPGYSNATLALLLLEGVCDLEAMASAVVDAQATEPVYHARLVDRSTRLIRRLHWRTDTDPVAPEILDLRGHDHTSHPFDWIVDEIYDRGRRARDLTIEPPLRVSIARTDDDQTAIGFECHHAATDGARLWTFAATVLALYHRYVVGEEPRWNLPTAMSAAAPSRAVEPASRLEVARYVREQRALLAAHTMTQVAGSPGGPPCQLVGRAVVAEAAAADELRRRVRALGSTLGDLAVAASMIAVAEWNRERGAPVDLQRHAVPVSQRGRSRSSSAELSMIHLHSLADSLDDPESLLRDLARQRSAALDAGIDVRLAMMVERFGTLSSFRPAASLLHNGDRSDAEGDTLLVTNPGIIWPEIVDGRPTGRIAIREAGGLRPRDWMAILNPAPRGKALAVMTFDGRLQLFLTTNRHTMTQSEVQDLAESMAACTRRFLDAH